MSKIFIIIFSLFVYLHAESVQAQFSTEELISAYEYALETNNTQNIENIERVIKKNSTTLSYIMANRSDLYHHIQKNQIEQSRSVLVSGSEKINFDNTTNISNDGAFQNNLDARKENAKKRLQRLNDHLSGELEDRSFTIVVSGVGDDARRSLLRLLKNELSMVKFVREISYRNSQVQYQIELYEMNLQKFANAYDDKRFGLFALELVNLSEKQADFLLKRN